MLPSPHLHQPPDPEEREELHAETDGEGRRSERRGERLEHLVAGGEEEEREERDRERAEDRAGEPRLSGERADLPAGRLVVRGALATPSSTAGRSPRSDGGGRARRRSAGRPRVAPLGPAERASPTGFPGRSAQPDRQFRTQGLVGLVACVREGLDQRASGAEPGGDRRDGVRELFAGSPAIARAPPPGQPEPQDRGRRHDGGREQRPRRATRRRRPITNQRVDGGRNRRVGVRSRAPPAAVRAAADMARSAKTPASASSVGEPDHSSGPRRRASRRRPRRDRRGARRPVGRRPSPRIAVRRHDSDAGTGRHDRLAAMRPLDRRDLPHDTPAVPQPCELHDDVDRGGDLMPDVRGRSSTSDIIAIVSSRHSRWRQELACAVESDPSCPVFIAWSMSSASPPRTSPTMIRSGRIRRALRRGRGRSPAHALDVGRACLERDDVGAVQPAPPRPRS